MADSKRPITVLLADDHVPVRDGLKRLIDDAPDLHVVAEAADGPAALSLVERYVPDVALVDVSMPGWDGVTLARAMSRTHPQLKIIAVTRHDDGGFVKKMMEAGACGYVLKQNATSNLVAAVRACIAGAVYVDPGVRSSAAGAVVMPIADGFRVGTGEPLTSIEQEVLRLFASAWSPQRIAEQLGLDRDDVSRVKVEAMQKAGLTTRLQVMAYVRSREKEPNPSQD